MWFSSKIVSFVATVMLCNTVVYSQVEDGIDYSTIRDSTYTLSCRIHSAEEVYATQTRLEAISEKTIAIGKEIYYRDLAMTYYTLYAMRNDLQALEKSSSCFSKALLVNPKYEEAWYGLSHNYFFQGNCDEVRRCVGQTIKYTPLKNRRKQKIYLNSLINDCQSNN